MAQCLTPITFTGTVFKVLFHCVVLFIYLLFYFYGTYYWMKRSFFGISMNIFITFGTVLHLF